jgi:hypothetical protein
VDNSIYTGHTPPSSIYDRYILVPQAAVAGIQDSYPPVACKLLRRDSALLRMRSFNEVIATKLIAPEGIGGLERIASRDDETATALLFSDPQMRRRSPKPDVANYCIELAKALGGDSIIFHRDHHAYDGRLSPLTWPIKRRFVHKFVRGQRPYELPWESYYAVFFERDPALAVLRACLAGELQLHDVAHITGYALAECLALYDAHRPPDGYRGNHEAQTEYLAAIDGVVTQ